MRRAVSVLGLAVAGVIAMPGASLAFGDGTFVIGQDISPGTYRAPGGEACYWARLSGFGGTLDEIIANGTPTGAVVVTILASDVGFETQGCGQWSAPIVATPQPTQAPSSDGVTPYLEFLPGFSAILDDLGELPQDAAAYRSWIDRTDDWAPFLLSVRPDDCYLGLYLEGWRLYGTAMAMQGIAMMPARDRRSFDAMLEQVFTVAPAETAFADAQDECL